MLSRWNKIIRFLWIISILLMFWSGVTFICIRYAYADVDRPVLRPTGEEWQPPPKQAAGEQYKANDALSAGHSMTEAQNRSDQRQPEAKQEPSKWSDPVTWFTGMLVIVGGAQAWIFWRQTKIQERMLTVTEKNAESTKIALEMAEKADLQLTDIALAPHHMYEPGAKLSLTYQNYGKTTAKDVDVSVHYADMPQAEPGGRVERTDVAPGARVSTAIPIERIHKLWQPDYARVMNEGEVFIIVIEYFDVFGARNRIVYDTFYSGVERGFTFKATSERIREQT